MQSWASPRRTTSWPPNPKDKDTAANPAEKKKKEDGRFLAAKPYVVEDEPLALTVYDKEKVVFVKEKSKHAADLDKDKDDDGKPYVVAHEPLALVKG